MGFWETAKKYASNIITLGGYSAVEESIRVYERMLEKHRVSVAEFNRANQKFQKSVETLGGAASSAVALLKSVEDFVRRLSYEEASAQLPQLPRFESPDLSSINRTLSDFNAAIEAGKGAGIGIAASTGAWLLVAHFGTASTGAAIGGLAGVAAHNAVLAWFGGGALAAGGGGMALGGLAIGGLLALPLFAFSAYKSYKESSRIDAEMSKVKRSAEENTKNAAHLNELAPRVNQLIKEITVLTGDFTAEFQHRREEALTLARQTAASASVFADALIARAKAKGASA